MSTQLINIPKEFMESYTGRELATAGFYNVHKAISDKQIENANKATPTIASSAWEAITTKGANAPFIAGGSIVRYLIGKGEWKSDFDFWSLDEDSQRCLNNSLNHYTDAGAANIHSQTYQVPIGARTVKVQSINQIKPNIPELLSEFDFTICQFAYNGMGDKLYCSPIGLADLMKRKLRLTGVMKNPSYTKTRMLKYMQLGFEPDSDAIKWLLDDKHPIIKVDKIEY